jgi:ABC-type amino acid transport substrate-binding protein
LRLVGVTYGPEAVQMLTQGEVQVVVFDAPTLRYPVPLRGTKPCRWSVGSLARKNTLSPRKPIDRALLEIFDADGVGTRDAY